MNGTKRSIGVQCSFSFLGEDEDEEDEDEEDNEKIPDTLPSQSSQDWAEKAPESDGSPTDRFVTKRLLWCE